MYPSIHSKGPKQLMFYFCNAQLFFKLDGVGHLLASFLDCQIRKQLLLKKGKMYYIFVLRLSRPIIKCSNWFITKIYSSPYFFSKNEIWYFPNSECFDLFCYYDIDVCQCWLQWNKSGVAIRRDGKCVDRLTDRQTRAGKY